MAHIFEDNNINLNLLLIQQQANYNTLVYIHNDTKYFNIVCEFTYI